MHDMPRAARLNQSKDAPAAGPESLLEMSCAGGGTAGYARDAGDREGGSYGVRAVGKLLERRVSYRGTRVAGESPFVVLMTLVRQCLIVLVLPLLCFAADLPPPA